MTPGTGPTFDELLRKPLSDARVSGFRFGLLLGLAVAFVMFVAMLAIGGSCAKADPLPRDIPVRVTLVDGPYALTEAEARDFLATVFGVIERDVPVRLQLTKLTTARNFMPMRSTVLQSGVRLNSVFSGWHRKLTQGRALTKGTVNLVLLPPFSAPGGHWSIAGLADGGCALTSKRPLMAAANVSGLVPSGRDYRPYAAYAVAHEIGHVLGTDHDSRLPASVMNPAVMYHVDAAGDAGLHFSERSKRELSRCIRR